MGHAQYIYQTYSWYDLASALKGLKMSYSKASLKGCIAPASQLMETTNVVPSWICWINYSKKQEKMVDQDSM